jgi:hypothetical protein
MAALNARRHKKTNDVQANNDDGKKDGKKEKKKTETQFLKHNDPWVNK